MNTPTILRQSFLILLLATMPMLAVAGPDQPLIGISVDVAGLSRSGHFSLGSRYVDAVTSAGGLPILIPPVEDAAAAAEYVKICDGILLSGGRDISPQRYGEMTTHPEINLVNPRREKFDLELIHAALEAGKPVLGVCLGSQELNVAMGGSLIQDLPTQTSSTINHKPGGSGIAHTVNITTGSLLADMVSTTSLEVNSIHHQACDRLGSGVLVMARAPDGVVEAFQVTTAKNFAVGIQWHPEALTDESAHLAIYRALVTAAQESKTR